ncbi:MAG: metallophosphoesterase [Clostridia bacterium]|nr:metallophosphoesterase [Clostridia bacterium]
MQKQNETLDIDRVDVPLESLPEKLEGFRFVVLSDLHIQRLLPFHDRVLEAVYEARPGCILIAGDTVDRRTASIVALDAYFSRLSRIAPCVAVLGNNDCDMFRAAPLRDMYAASGVRLLENESRLLLANGIAVRVTGLTDPLAVRLGVHEERPQPEKPEYMPLSAALRSEPVSGTAPQDTVPPSILLMHQPQLAKQYAFLAPSLIIAGHTHGGQFRVPLFGGLYAPGQGLLPRYTSGLYRIGSARMVVSRGLGNHGIPLRLNNRPHLPVVVMRRGTPPAHPDC